MLGVNASPDIRSLYLDNISACILMQGVNNISELELEQSLCVNVQGSMWLHGLSLCNPYNLANWQNPEDSWWAALSVWAGQESNFLLPVGYFSLTRPCSLLPLCQTSQHTAYTLLLTAPFTIQ